MEKEDSNLRIGHKINISSLLTLQVEFYTKNKYSHIHFMNSKDWLQENLVQNCVEFIFIHNALSMNLVITGT